MSAAFECWLIERTYRRDGLHVVAVLDYDYRTKWTMTPC